MVLWHLRKQITSQSDFKHALMVQQMYHPMYKSNVQTLHNWQFGNDSLSYTIDKLLSGMCFECNIPVCVMGFCSGISIYFKSSGLLVVVPFKSVLNACYLLMKRAWVVLPARVVLPGLKRTFEHVLYSLSRLDGCHANMSP